MWKTDETKPAFQYTQACNKLISRQVAPRFVAMQTKLI